MKCRGVLFYGFSFLSASVMQTRARQPEREAKPAELGSPPVSSTNRQAPQLSQWTATTFPKVEAAGWKFPGHGSCGCHEPSCG